MEGLRSESKVNQYTVIGAIGGLIVHESAQRYAEKNGIYCADPTQRGWRVDCQCRRFYSP